MEKTVLFYRTSNTEEPLWKSVRVTFVYPRVPCFRETDKGFEYRKENTGMLRLCPDPCFLCEFPNSLTIFWTSFKLLVLALRCKEVSGPLGRLLKTGKETWSWVLPDRVTTTRLDFRFTTTTDVSRQKRRKNV